jgi:hypothetical protein
MLNDQIMWKFPGYCTIDVQQIGKTIATLIVKLVHF